jgi:hypothetical protein
MKKSTTSTQSYVLTKTDLTRGFKSNHPKRLFSSLLNGRNRQSIYFLLSFIAFLVIGFNTHAKTFTSVGNGSWGSSSTWNQNGTPNLNNWPNDKVVINHAVTAGNLTMNGSAHWITINSGGSLTLTGTLNVVSSGQVHVNSGGSLTATNIYLNTSGTGNLNGTITATNNMDLDGAFVGSPTISVGNNLLAGAAGKVHDFTNLSLTVGGNMTVQNSKLKWDAGSVTVAGNFVLMGTGDVDVPEGSTLDISGTLSVTNNLFIGGPTGSGSGGVVSWGVGNVVLTGNNKGLNRCPLPYASPFDLKTCTQASGSDDTAPIIIMLGDNPSSVTLSGVYSDAGATASDDTDGDITANISVTNNVDVSTIGSYTVTYDVSDAAGNAATQLVRTVEVVDGTAPVITVLGNNPETIELGNTYTDAGATAVDDVDGDLSGNISTVNNVDVNTVGVYTVTYDVSDAGGNAATQSVRTVSVIADVTAPVITLIGDATVNVEKDDTYNDAGATVVDVGDPNVIVSSDAANVNTALVGYYTVTYTATDASGNEATTTRSVTVANTSTRELSVSQEGWHYLSFSCESITLGDVSGLITTTGYVLLYDESSISSNVAAHSDDAWTKVNSADFATTTVQKGDAVAIYTRDATTISYSCSEPLDDVAISLVNTCASDPNCDPGTYDVCPAQGWNLVGNPYDTIMDWDQLDVFGPGLANAIYLWDPSNNRYAAYVNGASVNGGTSYIAPGQGFFVYSANNNSNELVFADYMKSSQSSSFYRRAQPVVIDLSLDGNTNTIIRSDESATADFDMEFDAFELNNPEYTDVISTRKGNLLFAVNTVPDLDGEEMNLSFNILKAGEHSISMKPVSGMDVYLLDQYDDSQHNLSAPYFFSSEKGMNTNRFKLSIKKSSEVMSLANFDEDGLILSPNPSNGFVNVTSNDYMSTIVVYNNQGKMIKTYDVDERTFTLDITNLSKGVYCVKIVSNGKSNSKLVVKM